MKNQDFKDYEKEIIELWDKKKINNKRNNKNKDNKPFYFLQGPPYTSGKIHLGQAWNNSMKDFIIRFRKMQGLDVWNRAGYDMHGLPTARKVQAELKLETKEDIKKYGLDNFTKACLNFSKEKAELMNKDLKNLGIDMDFENAYMPINKEYIEGIWWLIKQAHKKNRLYEGLRTTAWCPSCSTALAKHEQEYKELEDTSIFVKFKVKNKDNEFLVIWTTTPWTISFNLGIMVNPDFDYVKVKVIESENENHLNNIWIIAKELKNNVEQHTKTKLEIIEEFKGETLDGLEYEHFWKNEIKELNKIDDESLRSFTVLLTKEYCTLDVGTGLVHCAPGCGPEDYEVGHSYKIPPFNNVKDDGSFPETMGKFSKWLAKKDDKKFIKEMENDNVLVGKQDYLHDYAHCERCHTAVIFKTTKQWFFKIEDLKKQMLEINKNINWNPKTAKNAFNSWLENLRDNSITKQRFWGTPVPIWKCDSCSKYKVIENTQELKDLGAENIPENLHRPWIDEVTIKCECGSTMHRIEDILDVWIDAGTASWNCLDYPVRKDLFEKYFPADFILEGKDQIRGWFNLLMIAGILGLDKNTFKNVYMHGFITDVDGVKMSKSLGNIIKPEEITNKFGSDTLRCYMSSTAPGEDISFSWDEVELRYRNLKILWNIKNFISNYSNEINLKAEEIKDIKDVKDIEEKYILSRLHETIKEITKLFENYNIDKLADKVIELALDTSREYIKLIRDKSTLGNDEDKKIVLNTLYTIVKNITKIFFPIAPFISEKIYQDLKNITNENLKESVYLEDWPKYNEEFISEELHKDMKNVQSIIQLTLAARDKAKIGIRWPLEKIIIQPESEDQKIILEETIKLFGDLIKNQINIKKIELNKLELKYNIKPNYKKIGKDFGELTGDILIKIKDNTEEITKKLENKEEYSIKIKDNDIKLSEEHFIIEKTSKDNLIIIPDKNFILALDTKQNESLIKEGFIREINRRIQQERKNIGLNKQDIINLTIDCEDCLRRNIEENIDYLKQKVNAKEIKFNNNDGKEYKIRDKTLKIKVEKL